ncbi:MAG: hypothetical protein E6G51_06725 [Actinobacteria bacterium]|nr:MAG: hypothetical protein E6G51_06725 [Actinomycetota bacterium]
MYVRIDGERTEEIAPGKQIRYVGATADLRTIYIDATAQLTPDDEDSSEDLYRWDAGQPDELTLVSVGDGEGRGNSDDCNVTWNGGGCGIEVIDFFPYDEIEAGQGGNTHSEAFSSSEIGDVYFESPEQLIKAKGEAGQTNLYLYREGSLRYVTTMEAKPVCTFYEFSGRCSSGPVARMQVTPDGEHMGIVTNSHLTGYDSGERAMMYLFDPDTSRMLCASCRPDGKQPTFDVTASQNGLFLTSDGRAFFSSDDPLVPRDTNGTEDIYEYSEGKPWLITTGTGPSLKNVFGFAGVLSRPGLVGVSANGTDVYFATVDTLVSQDHNGAAVKIYDARTGGGFPAERIPPNCTAADECHGPVSNAPALPSDRTSANLGNPKKPKAHKKKHKKCKKKHKKCKGKKRNAKQNTKQGGNNRG